LLAPMIHLSRAHCQIVRVMNGNGNKM